MAARDGRRRCAFCRRQLLASQFRRTAKRTCRRKRGPTVYGGQLWDGWPSCNACARRKQQSNRQTRQQRTRTYNALCDAGESVCGKCLRVGPLKTRTRCARCVGNGRSFWDRQFDRMRETDGYDRSGGSHAWQNAGDLERWTRRQSPFCHYCRVPLVYGFVDPLDVGRQASFDRIVTQYEAPDASRHVPDNVVVACRLCQFKRCAADYDLFRRYCDAFYGGLVGHPRHDDGAPQRWQHLQRGRRRPQDVRFDMAQLTALVERQDGRSPLSGMPLHFCTVPFCPYAASVDRIDSSQPYDAAATNIQLTTMADNLGKLDQTNAWFRRAELLRLRMLCLLAGAEPDALLPATLQRSVAAWRRALNGDERRWLQRHAEQLVIRREAYAAFVAEADGP
jgi:hypothetical protein